jgi:membrane-bound ClpP family serine protease
LPGSRNICCLLWSWCPGWQYHAGFNTGCGSFKHWTGSEIQNMEESNAGIKYQWLAPIGKAMINDKMVEAKSITGFIDENTEIVIVKIQNTNVVVKPKN